MIFRFSIGSYANGDFELEYKNKSLCCFISEYPGMKSEVPNFRFSVKGDDDWTELVAFMHKLKWKASYWQNISDGTQWQLKFNDKGLKIKSSGSNAYPPEFDTFLGFLDKLLRKHGVPFSR